MKIRQFPLILSVVLLLVLFVNIIEVNAMNTGFSTEELSEEVKNTFVSNISISLLTAEPKKRGILCFDVNDQGMIAVGQKSPREKEVCIYTAQGEFIYGYSFKCSGDFGVEWDEEHINIYFVRSDIIISLDAASNILDIKETQNTTENNAHSNTVLYATSRVVGDTTYLVRNNMGIFNWISSSYSQIITIDADGSECIIYDVSSQQLSNMIVTISIVCLFVFLAIAVITWNFVKLRRGN